jgi:hypothetical protein
VAEIAGRVEFGATLVTAAGLTPLALELVVTDFTGGAGCAVVVCAVVVCEATCAGCALAVEATTTAFEPELVLVDGVLAGAAAGGALVAAAVTEVPGWG